MSQVCQSEKKTFKKSLVKISLKMKKWKAGWQHLFLWRIAVKVCPDREGESEKEKKVKRINF